MRKVVDPGVPGWRGFLEAWVAMSVTLGLGGLMVFGLGLLLFTENLFVGLGLVLVAFYLALRWQGQGRRLGR